MNLVPLVPEAGVLSLKPSDRLEEMLLLNFFTRLHTVLVWSFYSSVLDN